MVRTFTAALLTAGLAVPALAGGIIINDPYLRAARPNAPNAAAFVEIVNDSGEDDRLIGVRADFARKAELHTHQMDAATGVARMFEVEDGFAIAAGQTRVLARGGDHVMLMGLAGPLEQGEERELTLIFEKAGEVTFTLPVDHERAETGPMEGGHVGMHGDPSE